MGLNNGYLASCRRGVGTARAQERLEGTAINCDAQTTVIGLVSRYFSSRVIAALDVLSGRAGLSALFTRPRYVVVLTLLH